MTNLDVWYAHADVDQVRADFDAQLKARQRKLIDKGMAKARTRDSMQELAKLTHLVDGRPRIIADPPLLVPIADLLPAHTDQAAFAAQIKDLLGKYRRTLETDRRFLLEKFEFADMARKVVGVGSVGTRCWIVLMLGRDESDPLFLQVKEAEASVLSRFVGASKYTNQGQRVVAGQRLMQAASDIFLGWQRTRPAWTASSATSTSASCGTGSSPCPSRSWCRAACGSTASCAGGRWRGRTPAPATGSPSPPTSAAPTCSTRPSPGSPPPTPTRTNATTKRSWTPSPPDGSPPNPTCKTRARVALTG